MLFRSLWTATPPPVSLSTRKIERERSLHKQPGWLRSLLPLRRRPRLLALARLRRPLDPLGLLVPAHTKASAIRTPQQENANGPLLPNLVRTLESSRRRSRPRRLADRPPLPLLLVTLRHARLVPILLLPDAEHRLALELGLAILRHAEAVLPPPLVEDAALERRRKLLSRLGPDELLVVGADAVALDELLRPTIPAERRGALKKGIGGGSFRVAATCDVVRCLRSLRDERIAGGERVSAREALVGERGSDMNERTLVRCRLPPARS